MPEFQLYTHGTVPNPANPDTGTPVRFSDLDPFTQGYIEAAFFTENSPAWDKAAIEADPKQWESDLAEGQSDGTLPGDAGFSDLAHESLASMIADCAAFQRDNADALATAYGHSFPARVIGDGTLPDSHRSAWDYDAEAAGRDYWYTRNGHGVGFWDRGLDDVGEELSDAARYSEVNAYFDPETGRVHFD